MNVKTVFDNSGEFRFEIDSKALNRLIYAAYSKIKGQLLKDGR